MYVLTEFALQLMKSLHQFNENNPGSTFKLRVGISNGSLMAGVVGQSKPLYDIWGEAVNMASRMDSTGVAGQIQVPRKTAEVLLAHGVNCEFQGSKFVKGFGMIETAFVRFDNNYELNTVPQHLTVL